MEDKSALAELAERLEHDAAVIYGAVGSSGTTGKRISDEVMTASSIVAELAKIEDITCDGAIISTILSQADRAIIKSRGIAEEGAGDGNRERDGLSQVQGA